MNVTPVLAADKLGAANACIAALATVADDAAELSVYVAKTLRKPKFPDTVWEILTLPVALPETVTELLVVLANEKLFAESIAAGCINKTAIYDPCSYIYASTGSLLLLGVDNKEKLIVYNSALDE